MPDKLEKINQLLALLQNDTVKPSDLKAFLKLLLEAVKRSKKELESLSADNIAVIKQSVKAISGEHKAILKNIDSKNKGLLSDFTKNLNEVEKLLKTVQSIEVKDGVDGLDADPADVVPLVLEKLPKPDEIKAEDIKDKLESLDGEDRLDASAIKNLPEMAKNALGGVIARNIYQLGDVVLSGLSDGEVLTYDATNGYWVNSTAGSSSPLTTKGDIYTYDSADARLPVGTDGQLLQADSAEATGLKWATSSATDELVGIDVAATAGYIGAASNDGVLRVGSELSYADGGDFVTIGIATDGINDTHIDWGTGANQVSAADVPIADGGGIITATDVEGALAENRAAIDAIESDYLTSASGLADLTDVVSATNTNRFALMANGSTGYVGRALVEADISDLGSYLTAETNDLTAAVTWANVPDANITESSVTQHVGAIDHDSLLNFAANEHFTESSIDHANIQNVGTYTHANLDNFMAFFNGTFQESFNALVTSDGATVTMSLEQSGTGDLTMRFSDGFTTLDCTPAATIALTAGSDASPTENFIYIPQSTKVLTKSTSSFPTSAEHIKVAYFLVPSAGFVQTNGCYINQNWNDHAADTNNQGHMAHMAERSRRDGAYYFSGIGGNGTDDYLTPTAANVEFKSTAGVIWQMHRQTFPAYDTSVSDVVLVKNWSGDAYHDVTNLYDITADSTGSAIGNNKYFNLVFWGVSNKSGEFAPMMVNLPSGSYALEADALQDVSGYDDLQIPAAFQSESSTGFLISRVTIQMQTGGGTWSVSATQDLRGTSPTSVSGGVAGTANDFPDNDFTIFDETDVTKTLNFDVGANLTTGNTRTITMADQNIDLTPTTGTYQGADAELTALAGLTSAGNKLPYFTGSGTAGVTDLTVFARSILDDQNEATFKATVNLEIGTDVLAQQTIGIADNNLLEVDDADAADNDYAKFTANGLEGRSYAEVKTDLSLNNVENTALSTWAGTANIVTVGTIGTGVWEGTDVGIAHGGTGQSTAQAAIDALTAVAGATNEHVLTKDTASGNAIWKAAAGGGVDTSGTPVANDFARFTDADTIEGRSYAEVAGDIGSSITTVGTIATGTWEGTDVGVAHGGTGKSSWTQYLIPYADTTTSFSQIAIGTNGQVLTSNGAGAAPTFQDAGGGGIGMTSCVPMPMSYFATGYIPDIAGVNYNSNTTMRLALVMIPATITVNKISFQVDTVNTAGSMNIMFYSADGQTSYIEETTSSVSSTGVHTHSLGSPVELQAGQYWMGCIPEGTANLRSQGYEGTANDDLWDGVSGEVCYFGSVTVTASTPPATFTPPTSGATGCFAMRLD